MKIQELVGESKDTDEKWITAYHGTSVALAEKMRNEGIKNPYLARDEELAWQYAEEADAEDDSGLAVVEVKVDVSRLRYDGNSMDEPVMADEKTRDAEWDRAAREHPEWVQGGFVVIPPEEWKYSWRGVGAVRYEGTIPSANIKHVYTDDEYD